MLKYKQGDVVWRRGTIGARREPEDHLILILASNESEHLNGERFYTCALISSAPAHRAGSLEMRDAEGGTSYVNLSQLMIAGENTFKSPEAPGNPKIGELPATDMARVKASMDALFAPDSSHFGKVVYSVTPSHDGVRGKPNRPYVIVGGIGRGTDVFFAVPVSSAPSYAGNGAPIGDLQAAGLARDEGEASHMRLAWSSTVNVRTSSQPAGRLSSEDRNVLYKQFVSFKKQLIAGVVGEDKTSQKKNVENTISQMLKPPTPGSERSASATLARPHGALSARPQPPTKDQII